MGVVMIMMAMMMMMMMTALKKVRNSCDAFAKLFSPNISARIVYCGRSLLASSCPSVCPSISRDFHEIRYLSTCENLSRKFKVH